MKTNPTDFVEIIKRIVDNTETTPETRAALLEYAGNPEQTFIDPCVTLNWFLSAPPEFQLDLKKMHYTKTLRNSLSTTREDEQIYKSFTRGLKLKEEEVPSFVRRYKDMLRYEDAGIKQGLYDEFGNYQYDRNQQNKKLLAGIYLITSRLKYYNTNAKNPKQSEKRNLDFFCKRYNVKSIQEINHKNKETYIQMALDTFHILKQMELERGNYDYRKDLFGAEETNDNQ